MNARPFPHFIHTLVNYLIGIHYSLSLFNCKFSFSVINNVPSLSTFSSLQFPIQKLLHAHPHPSFVTHFQGFNFQAATHQNFRRIIFKPFQFKFRVLIHDFCPPLLCLLDHFLQNCHALRHPLSVHASNVYNAGN